MSDWKEENNRLKATFTFSNFREGFIFLSAVAELAESMDHHPDFGQSWNKVNIELTTHDKGAVTDKDHEMAKQIDAVYSRMQGR